MKLSSTTLVAFVTLSLLPAQDGKQHTISPKAGEAVMFRHTQTATQNIEMMNQETTTETVTDLEVVIDEVKPDGTVHATATWKRIHGSLGGMQGTTPFDTAKKDGEDDPMFAGVVDAYHALINTKQKVVFAADGDVKELPGLDKTLAAALENVNGMAKMMLHGTLSEGAMKQQFAVFAQLPSGEMKDGTWTRKRDSSARGGLAMVMETTHKFTAQSADGYEVGFTGKVAQTAAKEKKDEKGNDGDDDSQTQMMRNMMKEAKISDGKIDGSQKARKDGLIHSAMWTMSMKIEMPNPMGGDDPFVVAVKNVTKLERVAADAKADKTTGDKAPAKK